MERGGSSDVWWKNVPQTSGCNRKCSVTDNEQTSASNAQRRWWGRMNIQILHIHLTQNITDAEVFTNTGLPTVMELIRRQCPFSIRPHSSAHPGGTRTRCHVGLASGCSLGWDVSTGNVFSAMTENACDTGLGNDTVLQSSHALYDDFYSNC